MTTTKPCRYCGKDISIRLSVPDEKGVLPAHKDCYDQVMASRNLERIARAKSGFIEARQ